MAGRLSLSILPTALRNRIVTRTLPTSKRLLWCGSSSEAARWTGTGARGMDGARPTGYLMMASSRLQNRGILVNNQATFGDQNNENALSDYIA
jgi:hypothetical protein